MSQRVIYTRDERKAQVLDIGLRMAQKDGIKSVSVSAIAREVGVTAPLLFHIFGNRDKLHRAIQAHARKKKVKLPTAAPAKKAVTKKSAGKAAGAKGSVSATGKRPARKRSIAEVKAIKDKAAGKRPTKKASAKKAAAPKKSAPVPASPAVTVAAPATAGQNAAAKTAGSKPKKRPSRAGKRFKTQPAPATADVATPGDAPAA